MIRFGDRLIIKVICPDCDKPMGIEERTVYGGIAYSIDSDFVSVMCTTEGCISRYFITTIEKKSGMVIYTNARYRPPQNSEETWTPVYIQYVDADGKALI